MTYYEYIYIFVMKQLYPDLMCFYKFKIVNSWLKCMGMSLDVLLYLFFFTSVQFTR